MSRRKKPTHKGKAFRSRRAGRARIATLGPGEHDQAVPRTPRNPQILSYSQLNNSTVFFSVRITVDFFNALPVQRHHSLLADRKSARGSKRCVLLAVLYEFFGTGYLELVRNLDESSFLSFCPSFFFFPTSVSSHLRGAKYASSKVRDPRKALDDKAARKAILSIG